MNFVSDAEYCLMRYCLKKEGRWWANHFFRNRAVNGLYFILRAKPIGEVFDLMVKE